MIELRDVRVSYGDSVVLDVPELTVPDRKLTAIVGPNGAGKSTLFSVAARLHEPDSGTAVVGGLDVATAPNDAIARSLAVLRQDNTVNVRLTVIDLVRFGRFPHSKGRLRPDDHAAVESALDYVELGPLRDRFLDQLSGGQRQRALIAMVLAQDTDHVLLDEPLNSLDIRHSVQMMRRLRSLVTDLGKTVAVVLHDINFAAAHADWIIAMRDGKVIAEGEPDQIIRPDVLQEVYEVEVEVLAATSGSRVAVYFT